MKMLKIDKDIVRYKAVIGVGGVGSGSVFLLNGDHTLGREESRTGCFLDQKDYCKLHIILHYVQTLLGPQFQVFPISRVGDDTIGRQLLNEMDNTGMVMKYMGQSVNSDTLFAFCFRYPDKSGGNMSTGDSACSKVDAEFVRMAAKEFSHFKDEGIVLAAPEVPLEARAMLLEMGREHGFFNVASFLSEEMHEVVQSDILKRIDLLAINIDEAAAAVDMSPEDNSASIIIEAAISKFNLINNTIKVSITDGDKGSWLSDGARLTHVPACKVQADGTAGAGDAYLAGLIIGVVAGLSLHEAQVLGTLVGSLAVTSPHAINQNINRASLHTLALRSKEAVHKNILQLLEE
jgi:sugar/nucleoside kinase (ribokinase family)